METSRFSKSMPVLNTLMKSPMHMLCQAVVLATHLICAFGRLAVQLDRYGGSPRTARRGVGGFSWHLHGCSQGSFPAAANPGTPHCSHRAGAAAAAEDCL